MQSPNMLLWYKHYFVLKAIEEQQIQESSKQGIKFPFVKEINIYKESFPL